MSDVLDETQPWPIDIGPPEEPPRNRQIEAVKDGTVVGAWRWRNNEWRDPTSFAREWRGWRGIVQIAIGSGWTLRSVPVVDPLDVGTAEMVRKQIGSDILPALLHGSWQFDQLGDGGKDEWRGIFRAALDAYHEAGGGR